MLNFNPRRSLSGSYSNISTQDFLTILKISSITEAKSFCRRNVPLDQKPQSSPKVVSSTSSSVSRASLNLDSPEFDSSTSSSVSRASLNLDSPEFDSSTSSSVSRASLSVRLPSGDLNWDYNISDKEGWMDRENPQRQSAPELSRVDTPAMMGLRKVKSAPELPQRVATPATAMHERTSDTTQPKSFSVSPSPKKWYHKFWDTIKMVFCCCCPLFKSTPSK